MSFEMSGIPELVQAPFSRDDLKKIVSFYKENESFAYRCCGNKMTPFSGGFVCYRCSSIQTWITRSTFNKAVKE